MSENGEDKDFPAISIAFLCGIKADKPVEPALEFHTGVARDCSQQEIDEILDKLRGASVRQKKLMNLEHLRTNVVLREAEILRINKEEEDAQTESKRRYQERLDKGSRAPYEMSVKERDAAKQRAVDLENMSFQIRQDRARIETLSKEITHASPGSAANNPGMSGRA